VEIEVETGAAQGRAVDNSTREVQASTSPNQSQAQDDYPSLVMILGGRSGGQLAI